MDDETFETSLGPIWIKVDQQSGDMRVWWPPSLRAGELAAEVLRGKARWHPDTRGWYVSGKRREEIYEQLLEL